MLDGHQRISVSAKLIACDINATKGLVALRSLKAGSLCKFQMPIGLNLFKLFFPTLGEEQKSYQYTKLYLVSIRVWRYQNK